MNDDDDNETDLFGWTYVIAFLLVWCVALYIFAGLWH